MHSIKTCHSKHVCHRWRATHSTSHECCLIRWHSCIPMEEHTHDDKLYGHSGISGTSGIVMPTGRRPRGRLGINTPLCSGLNTLVMTHLPPYSGGPLNTSVLYLLTPAQAPACTGTQPACAGTCVPAHATGCAGTLCRHTHNWKVKNFGKFFP